MFRKLFGRDPVDLLARSERALAEGSAVRALELAEKAVACGGESLERARGVADLARNSAIAQAIEKAEVAESEEDWEDAADWIEAALARLQDTGREAELEERLRELRVRAHEAEASSHLARIIPEEGDVAIDSADLYAALIEGLKPSWAERLNGRSDEFRDAWIALNEGQAAEALGVFEELAETSPDDPVGRLERGRCRLLLGNAEAAREDFEFAWAILGDEELDLSGHLSAPALWSDATLELGKPREVVDRLASLVDPERGPDELPLIYSRALLAAGEIDSATRFLDHAAAARPGQAEFPFLLAQALVSAGESVRALETLELAVAPTCSSGRCQGPSRHLPSIKMLARLHLDHGRGADRARELMAWVLRDQGGMISKDDEELLSRLEEP